MHIMIKFLNKLRNLKVKSYQEKRDNENNWIMIEKHIGNTCKNLLDIACDIGFYSFKAVQKGLFTVGLDIEARSIKKACKLALTKKQENIAFMKMPLNPSNVSLLPNFDIILCLSVFHHFDRIFGEENAKKMVAGLFAKCDKQFFFQIPSKKNKFGADFRYDFNNDKVRIEKYVYNLFNEIGGCSVKLIGKKKEKPPTEPYRFLFLIEKPER